MVPQLVKCHTSMRNWVQTARTYVKSDTTAHDCNLSAPKARRAEKTEESPETPCKVDLQYAALNIKETQNNKG